MAGFGISGHLLFKLGFEPAPLLLGFVLGRLLEEKLRQALVLSRGSFLTFFTRPVSVGLLLATLLVLIVALLPAGRKQREELAQASQS
jgi:putative tricarboxylic transport membrane protein